MSKGNGKEDPAWMQDCFIKGGTRLAIGAVVGTILAIAVPAQRKLYALAGLGIGLGLAGATCVRERADYLQKKIEEEKKPKSFFDSFMPSKKPDSPPKSKEPPKPKAESPKPKAEVKPEPKKDGKLEFEDKPW